MAARWICDGRYEIVYYLSATNGDEACTLLRRRAVSLEDMLSLPRGQLSLSPKHMKSTSERESYNRMY